MAAHGSQGSHDSAPTAAVCGTEVRFYGPVESNGRRPLVHVEQHPTYGHAMQVAVAYDDRQRGKRS